MKKIFMWATIFVVFTILYAFYKALGLALS